MDKSVFKTWACETQKIRENIIKMIHQCQSGHPGGSLSSVEILYALFADGGVMNHSPKKMDTFNRDRFILSKGHGVPALYAVLSAVGYDITDEELMTLRHLGSRLQGHPDRVRIPYIEASTGSLGQGASIAQGIAMAYKLDKNPHRVYSLIGDGEMQEGQIWEVASSAPHHKLSNLTLILDYNKAQIDGTVKEVLDMAPPAERWKAFGWNTVEIDGHNYGQIVKALKNTHKTKPTMIIANTIKGRGVSFMEENIVGWHGKATNDEECIIALGDILSDNTIGL